MEGKERYEIHIYDDICVDLYDNGVLDKSINDTYKLEELLNQQSKRIIELEEDQALLTILISGIDNLMHDKDYRFKNDNGTWYSRQSCKDLTNEEVYQEIIDEINQLDSNFEILDKENQQLKQQLHDLPKKIVEDFYDEIRHRAILEDDYCPDHNLERKYGVRKCLLENIRTTILKKYGGEDE